MSANFGCIFNPLSLVSWMQENNVPYSVDKIYLNRQNVVFSSFYEFKKRVPQVKRKRVFVFDCREKLETISNIKIVNETSRDYIYNFLLNNATRGEPCIPLILPFDPIKNLIEKNKSVGILHDYNTTLYSVTKKNLRQDLKNLVVKYVEGSIDLDYIDNLVEQTELDMRQSKTKESVQSILSIIKSSGFLDIKKAMGDLLKIQGAVNRKTLEVVALKYSVEPYDLNYFYSVIQKQKGS